MLDAAVEVLIDRGYDQLTLAEVARRAGVGRPLIYQWWGSKPALVQEALFRPPVTDRPVPSGEGFVADFTALVADVVALYSRPEIRAGLTGLIVDMIRRPGLLEETERRFLAPARRRYAAVLDEGRREGMVREGVDAGQILDTLRGTVWFATMLDPEIDTGALVARTTEMLLHGIVPRPGDAPGPAAPPHTAATTDRTDRT